MEEGWERVVEGLGMVRGSWEGLQIIFEKSVSDGHGKV